VVTVLTWGDLPWWLVLAHLGDLFVAALSYLCGCQL
jgi:hypothetical protein